MFTYNLFLGLLPYSLLMATYMTVRTGQCDGYKHNDQVRDCLYFAGKMIIAICVHPYVCTLQCKGKQQ